MLHNHSNDKKPSGKLYAALALTLSFAFIELFVGKMSGSLALIADAGHMFTDSVSIFAITITSFIIYKFRDSERYSFGLGKADVIAAFINVILILLITYNIGSEAISRIDDNYEIRGEGIILVASIGLIVNLVVLKLLGELKSLSAQSAKLHVIADLLGSVVAIISGICIYYTQNSTIDSILSLILCLFLIVAVFKQLGSCLDIVLDAIPSNIDKNELVADLYKIHNVEAIHDLHIWKSNTDEISLTAHIDMVSLKNWDDTLKKINGLLWEKYSVCHTTIQPETFHKKNDSEQIYHINK